MEFTRAELTFLDEFARAEILSLHGLSEKFTRAPTNTASKEIAKDISDVSLAAVQVSKNSAQVNISAEELAKMAEWLKTMVGRFKIANR